jgi:hypothetical protein
MAAGHYRISFTVETNIEDQTATLEPAVSVHGTVLDATTGRPIPKFRMGEGWPQWNPIDHSTNALWSTLGRFWADYSDGAYSKSLDEPVLGGEKNVGYFLKFVADGYAPSISRIIRPDEGTVELNVVLQPAPTIIITVLGSNGQPEAKADVGFVSAGARLNLQPGRFSWENLQAPGSLVKTDARGQFNLVPDDSILRVIAAAPDGYAEAKSAQLA